jgi:hypothetical protein
MEGTCPYYSSRLDVCLASLFRFALKDMNKYYCGGEDFDQCPMFLSKMLRTRLAAEGR